MRHVVPNYDSNTYLSYNIHSIEEIKKEYSAIRAEDHIARHGGDEFISLFIHIKHNDHAKEIAKRIIDAINKPIEIGGNEVSVGASIGISIFPCDGENLEELTRTADLAMYEVKNSGKGTYKFYRKDIH